MSPGTVAQFCSRNFTGPLLTLDCDLSDFRGLKHSFQKPAAFRIMRLGEEEATLEVNSSLVWKTDGKIHELLSFSR